MLDVHAPHKPMESTREFFFHLFTISVGLLIATQIESCVDWRHHVHLAEEARTSLRAEIEHNLGDLQAASKAVEEWRKQVGADLETMQKILAHPNDKAAQNASLTIGAHGLSLRDTAWRTAQSTGALAYMPYAEAQRYAQIYEAQAHLLVLEQAPAEDAARAYGLVAKIAPDQTSHITGEQAANLAQVFGQQAFHLANGTAVLKENIELNQAFLEGREPKGSFSEGLQ